MSQLLVITYPTALEFWLNGTNIDTDKYVLEKRKLENIPEIIKAPDLKMAAKELTLNLGLSAPVSFMTSREKHRDNYKIFRNYIRPKYLPPNSFIQLDTSLIPKLDQSLVFVATPEYCFLRATKDYSFAQCVEIGNNLCAIYVYDEDSSFCQRTRLAPVTKNAILKYLSNEKYTPYVNKAFRIAKCISDNSYSPIESKLSAIARIPKHSGGYGTPEGSLNYDIWHNREASEFLKADKSNCDIVWPKQKVIIEYDSDAVHGNAEQYAYDKKKYRALQMSGYKVFPVVKDDLKDLDSLDNLFFSVRKELGMRKDYDYFKKYLPQRREVFADLFKGGQLTVWQRKA